MTAGRLFLLPTPLGDGDDPARVLPTATREAVASLNYFVAENARTARAVLRTLVGRPLQTLDIRELSEHTPAGALPALLEPILAGQDGALLSEAGCPAVADPGAALVALAHERGVRVVPLVGPSALLLALMASGMNGQRFAFAGYVPVPADERDERLRDIERRSATNHETQILIETPYRTQALFDAALAVFAPGTRLGVASELTLAGESARTLLVGQWREQRPTLPRAPTVFTVLAEPLAHASAGHRSADGRARRHGGNARGAPRATGSAKHRR